MNNEPLKEATIYGINPLGFLLEGLLSLRGLKEKGANTELINKAIKNTEGIIRKAFKGKNLEDIMQDHSLIIEHEIFLRKNNIKKKEFQISYSGWINIRKKEDFENLPKGNSPILLEYDEKLEEIGKGILVHLATGNFIMIVQKDGLIYDIEKKELYIIRKPKITILYEDKKDVKGYSPGFAEFLVTGYSLELTFENALVPWIISHDLDKKLGLPAMVLANKILEKDKEIINKLKNMNLYPEEFLKFYETRNPIAYEIGKIISPHTPSNIAYLLNWVIKPGEYFNNKENIRRFIEDVSKVFGESKIIMYIIPTDLLNNYLNLIEKVYNILKREKPIAIPTLAIWIKKGNYWKRYGYDYIPKIKVSFE